MEVMKILCVLVVIISLASAFPPGNQNGNRGRGRGRGPPFGMLRGMGRGDGPPRFVRVMMMCGKDVSWPELRDKDCSSHMGEINLKINQIFGGQENEFFRSMISQNMNNPPCDKIMCFKRTLMSKVLQEGLPDFCEGRTEEAPEFPDTGFMSLLNPANRGDLIEDMKDGFCFGNNKLSYIIQAKIVMNQMGLKDHGPPMRGPMRHAKMCENFDASNVDCSDINPDAYIAAMYGTEEQWNAAVEQRKTTMMNNRQSMNSDKICKAKTCYGNALDRKMQQNNGKMSPHCRSLYERRREIFKEMGINNDKIKLMSCFAAIKASINYKISQDGLNCDSRITDTVNNLFSSDATVVNSVVERIMQAMQGAEESGNLEPEGITNDDICRFKAIKEKLTQNNNDLPSHCSDEEKFDSNLTSASVQDVKELLCMKMKRFKEYLLN